MNFESKNIHTTGVVVLIGILAMVVPIGVFLPLTIPVQDEVRPRVLAFYYNWYQSSNRYEPFNYSMYHPFIGSGPYHGYNSSNTTIMLNHLQMAVQAGIDSFITTWWGINTHTNVNFGILLNLSQEFNIPMQHTIYFEAVQERYNSSNPDAVKNIHEDIKYILETYGSHPNFLLYDGKPVIFIFNYLGRANLQTWNDAVEQLRAEGYKMHLNVDLAGASGEYFVDPSIWRIPIKTWDLQLFDGFHIYNPVNTYFEDPDLYGPKFTDFIEYARMHRKLACATVFPGYNDSYYYERLGTTGNPSYPRNDGETYRQSWNQALATGSDWILITTFNEWFEGTGIEPTLEFGDLYLNITHEYAAIHHAR
jgi:hypothetical protein